MRGSLLAATSTIFLSYAGEYMAYTLVLIWLVNLLYKAGVDPLFAYGLTGPVSFAYLLSSGVLSIPFGSLADRYGRRLFTVTGCAVAGFGLILLPVTNNLTDATRILLIVGGIYFFVGIGHASYTAGVLAFTGDVTTENESGEAFGLIELAEFASFSFAPALGGLISTYLGIAPSFLLSGLTLLGAGAVAFFGMREGKGPSQQLRSSEGEAEAPGWPGRVQLFVAVFRDSRILIAMFATMTSAVALQAFRNFVPLFGIGAGIPVSYVTLFVTLEVIASLAVAVPVGMLMDRTHRRMPVLVVGLVGLALALALTVLVPQVGPIAAWSTVFGIFLGISRVPPVVIINDGTVVENRAATMGASHAFEHAGYGVGALAGGFLLTAFGFTKTFDYLSAGIIAAALLFALFFLRRKIR